MRLSRWFAAVLIATTPALAHANDDDFDPITVDVVDALNCHIDARAYNSFALSLSSTEDRGAARRGWRAIKGSNAFMSEYRLPKPIAVTGSFQTSHIAFTGSAVLAVLDLPDPAALAKAEQITNQADPAAMLDALVADGTMTAQQAREIPRTNKFLGERVIVDETEHDDKLKMSFKTSIKRVISTVTSHPGKTLYGCAYQIEIVDDEAPAK